MKNSSPYGILPIGLMRDFCLALLTVGLVCEVGYAQGPPAPDVSRFLKQYCVACHSDKVKTADLSLENQDPAHPASAAEVWEKVIRKLRVGMMPPQGAPQP